MKNTAKPDLERWDPGKDGPFSEGALRKKLEGRGLAVTRYVSPVGEYLPDHTHGVDKIAAVAKGRYRIVMNGEGFILEPGDCLAVPKGAVHSAEVVGGEPVVYLDASAD